MNSLSWAIYFADIVGEIGASAGITALGLLGWWGVRGIVYSIESVKGYKLFPSYCLPVFVVAALIAIATPSREAVYAIAATEFGEEALKSKTGGKAIQALEKWIDSQIAGEPK